MTAEARIETTEHGKNPTGDGWFVLHTSEAPWFEGPDFGKVCRFEGGATFPQIGVNIRVIAPGQPACRYHRESSQEDFYVLSGECTLVIDDQERPLKAGHFVHCPAGTNHVFVGAGKGPCAILMIGARPTEELFYPVSKVAAKHGASAEKDTPDPREAYAGCGPRVPCKAAWPLF